jgi:3-oxoacyl-[acyl-carrier protein] reductase
MTVKTDNKIAIITGASRLKGIGAAICRELASKGIDIFFTYWTPYDKAMPWGIDTRELVILQEQIRESGVRCEKFEVDLADSKNIISLLNTVENKLGKPTILVNNATYSVDVSYAELSAEMLDNHYQVNIRGTMLLSAEFCKRVNQSVGGRIINITSGQSLGPMAGNIAYASTKGAIDSFTVTLSAEVASKGITVNAINPGPTDTGWMDNEIKQYILSRSPMGRVGLPQDASRLVSFLASDESQWITGQIIHSEGGFQRG